MKKLCIGLFFVGVICIWGMQGCGPGSSEETTTETVAEASKEKVMGTEPSRREPPQEPAAEPSPEPGPEAGPEPGSEAGPEPTQEDGPESQPEENTNTPEMKDEASDEAVAEDSNEMATDGGSGEGSVQDGGTSDTTVQEVVPEASAKMFNFTGAVFDFFSQNNPPIKDVKVCVHLKPQFNCATSDANGKFTLYKLPQDTDLYISFVNSSKKLMPLIVPINVPASSIDGNGNYNHRVGLLTEQVAGLIGQLMGISGGVDLKGKAHIVADVHDAKLNTTQGATITMAPTGGDGPHYITATGTKNPKKETSVAGIGLYLNVPPGKTYTITYKHKTKTCSAWPSTIRNTTSSASKFQAFKGFLIVTSGLCK